jgi:hypothetical protein
MGCPYRTDRVLRRGSCTAVSDVMRRTWSAGRWWAPAKSLAGMEQGAGSDGRLLDDFAISHTSGVNVWNAPSPAATSSLALARELVDRYEATAN